jgi:hypothetical protein
LKKLGAEVGDIELPALDSCALKHVENKEIDAAVGVQEPATKPESDS